MNGTKQLLVHIDATLFETFKLACTRRSVTMKDTLSNMIESFLHEQFNKIRTYELVDIGQGKPETLISSANYHDFIENIRTLLEKLSDRIYFISNNVYIHNQTRYDLKMNELHNPNWIVRQSLKDVNKEDIDSNLTAPNNI